MSLLSLLAAAVIAKRPDPRDAEIVALKADVDDLKRERDEWREVAVRYRSMVHNDIAWVQVQTAQLAQQTAAHQYNQTLSAQNLAMPWEFCNCVPARHDLLTRG
jgi:hypothetical protein